MLVADAAGEPDAPSGGEEFLNLRAAGPGARDVEEYAVGQKLAAAAEATVQLDVVVRVSREVVARDAAVGDSECRGRDEESAPAQIPVADVLAESHAVHVDVSAGEAQVVVAERRLPPSPDTLKELGTNGPLRIESRIRRVLVAQVEIRPGPGVRIAIEREGVVGQREAPRRETLHGERAAGEIAANAGVVFAPGRPARGEIAVGVADMCQPAKTSGLRRLRLRALLECPVSLGSGEIRGGLVRLDRYPAGVGLDGIRGAAAPQTEIAERRPRVTVLRQECGHCLEIGLGLRPASFPGKGASARQQHIRVGRSRRQELGVEPYGLLALPRVGQEPRQLELRLVGLRVGAEGEAIVADGRRVIAAIPRLFGGGQLGVGSFGPCRGDTREAGEGQPCSQGWGECAVHQAGHSRLRLASRARAPRCRCWNTAAILQRVLSCRYPKFSSTAIANSTRMWRGLL